jgi:hypothetical protein
MEHHAAYIGSAQMTTVPGLLQTEEYARAIFSASPDEVPPGELKARLEHRMRRQRIFDRESPPPYQALIHEAALRIRYGDSKVMHGQLERLLEAAEHPAITIRVIPFSAEGFTGDGQTMQYAGFAVPQLDTVEVDNACGMTFLDSEPIIAMYRTAYQTMESVSLGPEDSKAFISRLAQET